MTYRNIPGEVSLASSQNTREKNYWQSQLSGHPEKCYFPRDYHNVDFATGTSPGQSIRSTLERDISSPLIKVSNGSDHRLHIILLAGIAALLNKYINRGDLIVGTPIYRQDTKGEYINTVLAIRNSVQESMSFKELILQVKQTLFTALEHQNYSLEVLFQDLGLLYGKDGSSFLDIAVLLENLHDKQYISHITPNMIFSFLRGGEDIEITVEYNALWYKKATVERILHHFTILMRKALADVNLTIAAIDILDDNEKRQLLVDFNSFTSPYPGDKTIHELFEEQVEKTPQDTAVVYRSQVLSYKQLNDRVNRLAWLLREKGIKPDQAVGIMMDPSLTMIEAILGILKAGGAYLPIDTDAPRQRIKNILTESKVNLLLTGETFEEKIQGICDVLDLETGDLQKQGVKNPGNVNSPDNLAYILYTSGSTGEPKGAMIEHRNVHNLVVGLNERIYRQYRHPMIVGLLAPYIFDASVKQIFASLLLGHSLCLLPKESRFDAAAVLEFYRKDKIEISDGTPTLIHLFRDIDMAADNLALKHLIIGGEALSWEIVTFLLEKFKSKFFKITNVYGLTECCVDSTSYEISRDNIDTKSRVPIGTPLPNQQLYILDKQNRLQAVGIAGELFIGGDNVGRGYIGKDHLTAGRFIANPFEPGQRIYRTGDLARWLADGNIECLGRLDDQVKLRGIRIELGEIETRLLKHKGIKEAVVTVISTGENLDTGTDKQICAYFTAADPGQPPDISQLREYLSGTLPYYMIPAYFVAMNQMPLNTSGKINKKALPVPVPGGKEYIAPTTEVEKKLVELFSQVLEKEESLIGINDSFFELGGYSLDAIQLVGKIHKELNIKLSLGEIFKTPTVKDIASLLGVIQWTLNKTINQQQNKRREEITI